MTHVLIPLLLTLATPQATVNLAGRWEVQVEAARESTPEGGTRSRRAHTVVLDIEVDGTTVTGRFRSLLGNDVTLSGTWKDGKLDLASAWEEITVTDNGRPVTVKARWVVTGGWKDGVLGGTWDAQIGDSSLPQRWTGRREPRSTSFVRSLPTLSSRMTSGRAAGIQMSHSTSTIASTSSLWPSG